MISIFRGQYDFLSNFYYVSIKYEGEVYDSVEHAYQAAKTNNEEEREKIRKARTPAEAKKLAKSFIIRDDWDKVKVKIMKYLLEQKFIKGSTVANKLLNTYPHKLIEGNWWGDTFWGQCPIGNGENKLGELLMSIRTKLMLEEVE